MNSSEDVTLTSDNLIQVFKKTYLLKNVPSSGISVRPIFRSLFYPLNKNCFVSPYMNFLTYHDIVNYSDKNGHQLNFDIDKLTSLRFVSKEKLDFDLIGFNPILDLKIFSFSSLSRNLKQNIRNEFNNHKAAGGEIIFDFSGEKLDIFYQLLVEQYSKKFFSFFQPKQLFNELIKKCDGFLIFSVVKEQVHNALFCFSTGNTLHYGWAVRNQNFKSFNTLLQFRMIDFAKENGFSFLNFGASFDFQEKLLYSKLRWGANNFFIYDFLENHSKLQMNEFQSKILKIFFTKLSLFWIKLINNIAIRILVR